MITEIALVVLAGFMLFAGAAHFLARTTFNAQVPPWLPLDTDVARGITSSTNVDSAPHR